MASPSPLLQKLGMELIEAAMSGQQGQLHDALSGGVCVDFRDPGGQSALFWAALNGHAEALSLLLSAGATVDLRNDGGQTALMGAALRGQIECSKLLLAAGADVNASDSDALTPWAWAALNEKAALCDYLAKRGADSWAHHRNHRVAQKLPVFQEQALAECDGKAGHKLYVGCLGLVFDVSAGSAFYGPGGSYAAFAGRDATLSLARHTLEVSHPASMEEVDALTISERMAAENWTARFKTKYELVGRLPILTRAKAHSKL